MGGNANYQQAKLPFYQPPGGYGLATAMHEAHDIIIATLIHVSLKITHLRITSYFHHPTTHMEEQLRCYYYNPPSNEDEDNIQLGQYSTYEQTCPFESITFYFFQYRANKHAYSHQ